jgi:hypothetical protein
MERDWFERSSKYNRSHGEINMKPPKLSTAQLTLLYQISIGQQLRRNYYDDSGCDEATIGGYLLRTTKTVKVLLKHGLIQEVERTQTNYTWGGPPLHHVVYGLTTPGRFLVPKNDPRENGERKENG